MSPVLQLIAQRYRKGRAGQKADATRDLIFAFPTLLKEAGCVGGTARYDALREIETLAAREILSVKRHRLDPSSILEVRLPLASAPAFFEYLGESAPHQDREALAEIFLQAMTADLPEIHREGWQQFCRALAEAARVGKTVQPFDRSRPEQVREILRALPRILGWQGESLMRFASASLFRDSKMLEAWRSPIEASLIRITGGKVARLGDLGILENDRSFLLHGPLRLCFEEGEIATGLLEFPVRLGAKDISRARLASTATRCVTVENAAMLNELAKLRSGVILASSGSEGGYANAAVIEFLGKLPPEIELWHFGDSDPKGFDILRDLRTRTGKTIQSLHMRFRLGAAERPLSPDDLSTLRYLFSSPAITPEEKHELRAMKDAMSKGDFEQESLGRPKAQWPFYEA